MYVQQLTIFDALDDIAVDNGRATFQRDVLNLIDLRLSEMGIKQYFEPSKTKVSIRTCGNGNRVFAALLSDVGYLNDVQIYPSRPDLYHYLLKLDFLANEDGLFRDGMWMHERSVIEHCHFKDSHHLYEGLYYWSAKFAEVSIANIIKTGFVKDI